MCSEKVNYFLKISFCSHFVFTIHIYSLLIISHHDVTPITMALNGATQYPQACQALTSMLSRNNLNPADITVLFRNYSAPDPPPIDLIRTPQFLGKSFFFFFIHSNHSNNNNNLFFRTFSGFFIQTRYKIKSRA